MAEWTQIPADTFDIDRPILGSTHLAIVQNFEAMAEGAVGAPRVEDGALNTAATNAGRDWVLARNALAVAGSVGTYAFALHGTGASSSNFGQTLAGSNVAPIGIATNPEIGVGRTGSALTGTWRCMGAANNFGSGGDATLWLRIS